MRIISHLRARLGARPDSEHEQAAVRVAIVAILFLYVLLHGRDETAGSRPALMLVALGGGYLAISLVILAAILARPAPSPLRRIVAMITDFSAFSGFMHLGGASAAPFYPVYLWIALGNGFRYGLSYLAASVAAAAVGFSAVVLTTAFWLKEWPLALGMLTALVILPGYAATLIRKLTEAKAQAEAASLAKTRFLAGVSHELRTPLNAIIGTSDLMRGTPLDADQREMVHTVKTAGTTLLALIDDILDVSRIEADRTVVDASDFDLHAALADVLSIFRPGAGERMLRLAAQIDPAVPWRLYGDARHLRQILTNLIGNALKFTQQGSIIVRAEPRSEGQAFAFMSRTPASAFRPTCMSAFRTLRPGRRGRQPPLRRHRPRSRDLPESRGIGRRDPDRPQRAGPRQRLLPGDALPAGASSRGVAGDAAAAPAGRQSRWLTRG